MDRRVLRIAEWFMFRLFSQGEHELRELTREEQPVVHEVTFILHNHKNQVNHSPVSGMCEGEGVGRLKDSVVQR